MLLNIHSLDEANAREIAGWHYDSPYDFYNLNSNEIEQSVQYFLDLQNNFYGIFEEPRKFVGYCSFGKDGQVPGGNYSTPGLDIGMGICPNLTGRGRGRCYVAAVLNFAQQMFAPAIVRVTIAAFNQRALQVWYGVGFHSVDTFEHQYLGVPFIILVRETDHVSKA
ncbi:GNAT family N-acetyltransferase [Atlanticothrix silvestris]|uniref:GNAT family N-acetyltransferase n=1 Tax=Atlanticothrix silvestris TaxID=2840444 RepID=UPI001BDC49FE|nr:N-acetyltransferase [Atlanticothrix silvestris]